MDRKEYAVQLKHSGYNCCQAVLCAFEKETNLSEEQLKQLGASFGVGMGNMEATCGALCGAEMLLGLKKYENKPILPQAKQIHAVFEEKCGATLCKDLKGRDTGVILCECDDCVRNAIEVIHDLFED